MQTTKLFINGRSRANAENRAVRNVDRAFTGVPGVCVMECF